jgi:hypothetical protein
MATQANSVGRAQHSAPTFTLFGRIAAAPAGKIGKPHPSLHISLIIDDAYTGLTVIDGQPTMGEAGLRTFFGSGPTSTPTRCRIRWLPRSHWKYPVP